MNRIIGDVICPNRRLNPAVDQNLVQKYVKRHQELRLIPGTMIVFPNPSSESNISKYFITSKAIIQNYEILPENRCNFIVIALELKVALYTDLSGGVKGFNVLDER